MEIIKKQGELSIMNPYLRSGDAQLDHVDLMKYLLRRIIWILLCGVICAGIAWKVQTNTVKKLAAEAAKETEVAVEAVKETEAVQAVEYDTEAYELKSSIIGKSDEETRELLREQKEYLETAPYMQLDPNHIWKARAVIWVGSQSRKYPAYQIEELYRVGLTEEAHLQEYAKKKGIEARYLKELISTWLMSATDSSDSNSSDVVVHEEEKGNWVSSELFSIQAVGNTQEEAQELLDALLDELQVLNDKYAKEYPHEIKVMSRTCLEVYDSGIRNTQKDQVSYTQSLLNLLDDFESKSDKAEAMKAAPVVETEAETETEEEEEDTPEPMSPITAGVIGFAAGVLLACIWFTVRYLRNDKLIDYRDIGRQGICLKELGTISEQGIAMAAANIRNFAKDRKKLFLTGMASQTEFDHTCKNLQEYLSEYEIVYARDVIHDPKAREELIVCDAAILVEQKVETHYSDLKEEVTFLYEAGKEIIGIIIL